MNIPPRLCVAALAALLLVVFCCGLYESLHIGLTWDEFFEQKTVTMDAAAVKGLAAGDPSGYNDLLAYKDKFYGLGFHVPVLPVQSAIASAIAPTFSLDSPSAFLLAKHPLVFLTFAGSAVLFYLLLRTFIAGQSTCLLFTAVYCMYPYLFGHAMFNVKDVPFLFAYLLCTWYSLACAAAMMRGGRFSFGRYLVLVLLTAWLVSIRIGGLIILGQYFFMCLLLWSEREGDKKRQFKAFLIKGALFLVLLLALVIAAYPLFWLYPAKLVDALLYMSRLPEEHTTLTLGTRISARDLPGWYIPVWLFVKLPFVCLVSFLLLPVAMRRMAFADKTHLLYLGTFLFVALFVPVYLTIAHVAMYNDVRQILFVFPFYLLLTFIILHHLFPRAAVGVALAYVILFAADGIMLYPYQYTWMSEPARLMDHDANFETDYWGISGRVQSEYIAAHPQEFPPSRCYYVQPLHLYRPFLPASYQCARSEGEVGRDTPRPYFLALYAHGYAKLPRNCDLVQSTSRRLLFSGPVSMSQVFSCH